MSETIVYRKGKVTKTERPLKETNKRKGDVYIGQCFWCKAECLCVDLDNGHTRTFQDDEIMVKLKGKKNIAAGVAGNVRACPVIGCEHRDSCSAICFL